MHIYSLLVRGLCLSTATSMTIPNHLSERSLDGEMLMSEKLDGKPGFQQGYKKPEAETDYKSCMLKAAGWVCIIDPKPRELEDDGHGNYTDSTD